MLTTSDAHNMNLYRLYRRGNGVVHAAHLGLHATVMLLLKDTIQVRL